MSSWIERSTALRNQQSAPPRALDGAPFVGRTVERAQMVASLDQVSGGDPLFLSISGEAGVGKTRLVLDAFERSGHAAHWARCNSGSNEPVFWPLVQLLRSIRLRLGNERYLDAVGNVGFGLLEPLAVAPQSVAAPVGKLARFRLFDQVLNALNAVAKVEPLYLIVDDVQWADLSTLSLLGFLAQSMIDAPIGVFVTIRDHDSAGQPEALQALVGHSTVIRLNRLNRRHTTELLTAMSGGEVSEGYAESAFESTGGNPHYLVEYASLVPSNGTGFERRLWKVSVGLMERARRLPAEVRRLVDAASVVGETFDIDTLAATVGDSAERVVSLLTPAATAGLIAARGGNQFAFVHGLNREAILDALDPQERAKLHGAVAEALEAHGDRDSVRNASAVAHHLTMANLEAAGPAVLDRLVVAARAANEAFAREEATRRYRSAIDAADRLISSGSVDLRPLRIDLGIELGTAHMSIAQPIDARETLREAALLARELNDVDRLARVALAFPPGLEGVAVAPAADVEQVEIREEVLERLPEADSCLRAELMGALATCRYWTAQLSGRPSHFAGSLRRQDELSSAALQMAYRLGDERTLARCILTRLHAVWTPDYRDERPELIQELVALAEKLGDLDLLAAAVGWQILEAFDAGRLREAGQMVRTYADLADRLGQPYYRRNAQQWSACVQVLRGDINGGIEAVFATMTTTAALIGDENAVAEATMLLSVQRFFTGDYEALIEPARHVIASNRRTGLNWQCGLMFMLAETGEHDEAGAFLEQLMGDQHTVLPRDINWLVSSHLLALTVVALGDLDRAIVLYEAMLPFEDIDSTHGWGYASYGPVGWVLGELALVLGREATAVRHFEQVIANRESGPYRAVAELRLCEVLIELGDEEPSYIFERVNKLASRFRAWGARRFAIDAEKLLTFHKVTSRTTGNLVTVVDPGWRLTSNDFGSSGDVSGRGMRYLVELLIRPNEPVGAVDLLLLATSAGGSGQRAVGAEVTGAVGRLGEVIDSTARRAFDRRLGELETSRSRAVRRGETSLVEACDIEIRQIRLALSAALAPGGRLRQHPDDAERARVSVTKAIRRAILALHDDAPKLAAHLDATIVTGMRCSYGPNSETVEWLMVTSE